jgi:hypothetical protein
LFHRSAIRFILKPELNHQKMHKRFRKIFETFQFFDKTNLNEIESSHFFEKGIENYKQNWKVFSFSQKNWEPMSSVFTYPKKSHRNVS